MQHGKFGCLVQRSLNGNVFTSVKFTHGNLAKGTYKLHIGEKVFEGELDRIDNKDVGFNISWKTSMPVSGKDI